MARLSLERAGLRGIGLIAVTYIYFLIFAQFAFLKRLVALGIAATHLPVVMGAMAIGGILFSLLAPRIHRLNSSGFRIRASLTICSAAAFLSLMRLTAESAIGVAFLIGCGLGLLTVTLVTYLRMWLGENPLLKVGLGTALGYFACNIPQFFTSTDRTQSIVAGALCLAGMALPTNTSLESTWDRELPPKSTCSFLRLLCCLTALVWLDSAAFFIIQNTPALKAGTWEGTLHLWANGTLHFAAALFSVWILRRRGLSFTLSVAFAALGAACLLLLDQGRAVLASAFYPVGVSLYSVALVAYPSLLTPAASTAERARQAGWIYAVAGWIGSAMGIGMGQNLGHVPPIFVLVAGLLVLSPILLEVLRSRKREVAATTAILLGAFGIERCLHAFQPTRPKLSSVERGRLVYTSEGCIHCHSQYVRPNTPDALMWGPVKSLAELREHPVVIGNRRQGPDLAEIGTRRSPLWLKAHFYNPSEVSSRSFMPSYAYLFRDHQSISDRGDDLIAYLTSLRSEDLEQQRITEAAWRPSSNAILDASINSGSRLFESYCATCHSANGATRQHWRNSFRRLPPDLLDGPYLHLQPSNSPAERVGKIAQIVKFGLPGTDMPGHEYLPDGAIASISLWLAQNISQSLPSQTAHNTLGERP